MDYQIETVNETTRKLTVTLSSAAIEAALEKAALHVQPEVQIKGFRKGKVPTSHVARVFRKELLTEAVADLAEEQIRQVTLAEKLSLVKVDTPDLEDLTAGYISGSDMVLPVTLEIIAPLPDIDLANLEIQWIPEVDDKQIDRRITELREQKAVLKPVEDRDTPQADDTVVVDFTMAFADDPDHAQTQNDVEVVVGDRTAKALPFPEIMDVVEKATKGVELSEDLVTDGDAVKVTVMVKEIKAKVLPEMDAAFMAEHGQFEDEAAFRRWVKDGLQFMQDSVLKDSFFSAVMHSVVKEHPVHIPDHAAQEMGHRLMHERFPHFVALSHHAEARLTPDERKLLQEVEQGAQQEARQARISLEVINKLKAQLGIEATEADVQEFLARTSDLMGRPVPKLKVERSNEEWLDDAALYKLMLAVKGAVKLTPFSHTADLEQGEAAQE